MQAEEAFRHLHAGSRLPEAMRAISITPARHIGQLQRPGTQARPVNSTRRTEFGDMAQRCRLPHRHSWPHPAHRPHQRNREQTEKRAPFIPLREDVLFSPLFD